MTEDPNTPGPEASDPIPTMAVSLARVAREHPGFAVSMAYFAASAVGMLSSVSFYGYFGINVFHYAQLSDFILVAIRNPAATLAILLSVPVVWTLSALDRWLGTRFRWYRLTWGLEWLRRLGHTPAAMVLYFLAYAWLFAELHSERLYQAVESGDWPSAEVQFQSGTYLGRDATMPFEALVLGATSTAIFLYDADTDRATVVPLENVAALVID